jgi:hypothetical protein
VEKVASGRTQNSSVPEVSRSSSVCVNAVSRDIREPWRNTTKIILKRWGNSIGIVLKPIVYVAHVTLKSHAVHSGRFWDKGKLSFKVWMWVNWTLNSKIQYKHELLQQQVQHYKYFPRCKTINFPSVILYSFGIVTLSTFEENRHISRLRDD